MDIECTRPTEHFFWRAVRMGFGERLTPCPSDKVVHRSPPGLDLVVALRVWVVDECSSVMVESNRARAMNFIADETGRLVDEVDPITETVFEIDLVSPSYWDAISNDNHCAAFHAGSYSFLGRGPELTCGASLSHSLDATQYKQKSPWS